MTRKTMLDKKLQDRLVKNVRKGLTYKLSCKCSGVSLATFYQWKGKGMKGLEPYATFLDALEKAEQELLLEQIANITTAGLKDWKASAWLLERRYKEAYAKQTQITGNDGGPIQVEEKVLPEEDISKLSVEQILELIEALKEAEYGDIEE